MTAKYFTCDKNIAASNILPCPGEDEPETRSEYGEEHPLEQNGEFDQKRYQGKRGKEGAWFRRLKSLL